MEGVSLRPGRVCLSRCTCVELCDGEQLGEGAGSVQKGRQLRVFRNSPGQPGRRGAEHR